MLTSNLLEMQQCNFDNFDRNENLYKVTYFDYFLINSYKN